MQRIPPGVWGWPGTALVVLLVCTPPLVVLQLAPATRTLGAAASVGGLVTYPVVLVAAVLLYFHWRITDSTRVAWLACGLTATAVQELALSGLRLAGSGSVESGPGWFLLLDLAFALTVLAMLTVPERVRVPADPLALGLVVGLTITALRLGGLAIDPSLQLPPVALASVGMLVLVTDLAIAAAVLRAPRIPDWGRGRLALGMLLLSFRHAGLAPGSPQTLGSSIILAADVAAAILLCTTAVALLRLSIRDSTRATGVLHDRVEHVEAEARADQERLHEIKGTIAGIASASRLIRHGPSLPAHRQWLLERMMESEIERLQRLTSERDTELEEVDLDATIRPLVLAHDARGRVVHWEPSGQRASGRADDLAEVITILLDNAARHAPDTETVVGVERIADSVEIRVSDSGPGVSPALETRLFEWGARGPQSSGQGIGLSIARRLMKDQGGDLRYVGPVTSGATFVVCLPIWGERRGAANGHPG